MSCCYKYSDTSCPTACNPCISSNNNLRWFNNNPQGCKKILNFSSDYISYKKNANAFCRGCKSDSSSYTATLRLNMVQTCKNNYKCNILKNF